MANPTHQIPDEGLSFRELVERVQRLVGHLVSKWKTIAITTLLIFGLYVTYSLVRKPTYTAETTFVLETGGVELGGSLGSIASIAGFDLGGMAGGSPLFQTENIVELYRSREMLKETFLTSSTFMGKECLLIDRYAEFSKLRKKWDTNEKIRGIDFNIPKEELTVQHDSLLFEVIRVFRERNLVVEKPSRQLSILSVKVSHKDQLFAKAFNEALVRKVNHFYLKTKTKRTEENLRILQFQTDSVHTVMNQQLQAWSEALEEQPNVNKILKTPYIKSKKLEIDLKTSSAAYEQLVTNLEMAKVTLRNNTPLIQIIDHPSLPLQSDKMKLFKLLVLGVMMGAGFSVLFFTFRYIFHQALKS